MAAIKVGDAVIIRAHSVDTQDGRHNVHVPQLRGIVDGIYRAHGYRFFAVHTNWHKYPLIVLPAPLVQKDRLQEEK